MKKRIRNTISIHQFFVLILLLLLISVPVLSVAEPSDDIATLPGGIKTGENADVKLGIVLSGGGARGMAHVGVLKRLEELRIPVDYITGTSMGGIVAGLYASGMSASEIEQVMIDTDWIAVFNDNTDRKNRSIIHKEKDAFYPVKSAMGFNDFSFSFPRGIIEGQKVSLLIRQLIFL